MSEYFPAARLPAMKDHIERFAASFGITDVRFPAHLSNTRRPLAVAEYARDQGKLAAFRDAAMDAYWRTGQNLELDEVLAAVAAGVGLDPKAAVAAADDPAYQARIDARRREAEDAGVTGIPTFLFGKHRVVGCQPYEILAAAADAMGATRR